MPQSAEDPGLACCENEVTGPTVAQERCTRVPKVRMTREDPISIAESRRPKQPHSRFDTKRQVNSQADALQLKDEEKPVGLGIRNSRTAGQALTFRQGRPVTNKVLIPESDSRNAAARRVSAWFQRAYASVLRLRYDFL